MITEPRGGGGLAFSLELVVAGGLDAEEEMLWNGRVQNPHE